MNSRNMAILVFLFVCAMLSGQNAPQVKKTAVKETSPASGKEMYLQYCASCHGKEGKGDGPAAAALKAAPNNLATPPGLHTHDGIVPRVERSVLAEHLHAHHELLQAVAAARNRLRYHKTQEALQPVRLAECITGEDAVELTEHPLVGFPG